MKLLFENWRKYLSEGMKTPADLLKDEDHEDLYIRSEREGDGIKFYYSNSDGEEIGLGYIEINPAGGELLGGVEEGPCDGAWVVLWSEADKYWGPLLYDVAIEWATENGGQGLTPDRTRVSKKALAVWDFYLKNRSGVNDVNNSQLDNLDNELTKRNKQDNCNQTAARTAAGRDWHNSSLSKRYTKAPDTLRQLRDAEPARLIEK
jgi:hypothetical protein